MEEIINKLKEKIKYHVAHGEYEKADKCIQLLLKSQASQAIDEI